MPLFVSPDSPRNWAEKLPAPGSFAANQPGVSKDEFGESSVTLGLLSNRSNHRRNFRLTLVPGLCPLYPTHLFQDPHELAHG
jgi:hypothetical protein